MSESAPIYRPSKVYLAPLLNRPLSQGGKWVLQEVGRSHPGATAYVLEKPSTKKAIRSKRKRGQS